MDRLAQFEAKLAALKSAMEGGLADRARGMRALAARVAAGDEPARAELKTESHKLRGVAGTYGHDDLSQLAGHLEQQALVSTAEVVARLARELATLAEAKGRAAAASKRAPEPTGHEPRRPSLASAPDPERASQRATAIATAAVPRTSVAVTAGQRPSSPRLMEAARPAQALGSVKGPRLRVLAIDDDAVTQRLLTLTLQQVGGFEATIVASAQAALALLEQHEYDVVVSDAMMPDMNGMEFRRVARARGLRLPIVILSAASPDELGWPMRADQAGDWLRKPFRPTELVRDLLRIAARSR
jgi:CheY-like chemotaxis protein